jgi:hypothetical protein
MQRYINYLGVEESGPVSLETFKKKSIFGVRYVNVSFKISNSKVFFPTYGLSERYCPDLYPSEMSRWDYAP